MTPGTTFAIPLKEGLYCACRVLREAEGKEIERVPGHVLAYATQWYGEELPDLKNPLLRKKFKLSHDSYWGWFKGDPPEDFVEVGVVPVRKSEDEWSRKRQSIRRFENSWNTFRSLLDSWEAENAPAIHQAKIEASKEAARPAKKASLATIDPNERYDLGDAITSQKPKGDREPEEVLIGFITAMNRWESESHRIHQKYDATAALALRPLQRDSMQEIFDEFCTPKERKYGRLGSYSIPPGYDPSTEVILNVRTVKRGRVEIDTEAGIEPLRQKYTYVLLKKRQGWLIDNRNRGGSSAIL
jgi:hypothetical protein